MLVDSSNFSAVSDLNGQKREVSFDVNTRVFCFEILERSDKLFKTIIFIFLILYCKK